MNQKQYLRDRCAVIHKSLTDLKHGEDEGESACGRCVGFICGRASWWVWVPVIIVVVFLFLTYLMLFVLFAILLSFVGINLNTAHVNTAQNDLLLMFISRKMSEIPRLVTTNAKLRAMPEQLKPLLPEYESIIYLIPVSKLASMGSFLIHEEAMAQETLLGYRISDLPDIQAASTSNILFVSHKWKGNEPDQGNAIFKEVKHMLGTMGGLSFKYVWFDFTCVPQKDAEARAKCLKSIPWVVRKCEVSNFVGDYSRSTYIEDEAKQLIAREGFQAHLEAIRAQYYHSVWCQLENIFVFNYQNMSFITEGDQFQWTMFDLSDFYEILPGFLVSVCGPFRWKFLYDQRRADLLASLLKKFIDYHDEQSLSRAADHKV